jgi:hypothetical protein
MSALEAVRAADTGRREPQNKDAQALANLERARIELSHLDIPDENLTDDQAIGLFGRFLRERIPAPAVPAGSPAVNAQVWAAAALTAGGFRAPEDRGQRADLGDDGPDVDLGVIGILVMRHLSGSAPAGWTDEDLATKFNELPETFARAQRVIDEAAQDVGRPATPAPRWWLAAC